MIEISTPENELKHGDWVYTPNEVFGSSGKEHNIFQYDERINYSLDFTNPPVFYRILPPQQVNSVDSDGVGLSINTTLDSIVIKPSNPYLSTQISVGDLNLWEMHELFPEEQEIEIVIR